MVSLNKGATVELVKALSDDIRTLPDGTKARSAGAALYLPKFLRRSLWEIRIRPLIAEIGGWLQTTI